MEVRSRFNIRNNSLDKFPPSPLLEPILREISKSVSSLEARCKFAFDVGPRHLP